MGVAGDDDDGGVGEVDADQQLDGRPQAVRARSSVRENPEEPGIEHNFNPFCYTQLDYDNDSDLPPSWKRVKAVQDEAKGEHAGELLLPSSLLISNPGPQI